MAIVFTFDQNKNIAKPIIEKINAKLGRFMVNKFPDQETCIRILDDVKNQEIIVICSLNDPDSKIIPLLFLCATAKELGAKTIILVAPYLGYMRQDIQFKAGESVSSKIFADILSPYIDKLITIDPHLHRLNNLGIIYKTKTKVLHSTNLIARWILYNIQNPLLIGPDQESIQWIKAIAEIIKAPFIIGSKKRTSAYEVEVQLPNLENFVKQTPVLIDDVISTGNTLTQTLKQLKQPAYCITVHPLFAGDAYEKLKKANHPQIISCNTIQHESNRIDVSELIADYLNCPTPT